MRSSATTALIDEAMALVQAELLPVGKDKSVEVDGAKAKWGSRFATFEALHAACKASLIRHKVAIFQGGEFVPGGGGERLVTRLSCGGEWIESSFPVKVSRDGAQGFGGGVSFAKRWGVCGMVGLVSTDDIEEKQGYQDNRPVPARAKAKAPAGIVPMLEAIRAAESPDDIARAAGAARAAHPTGEGAAAVEQTLGTWFVSAFDGATTLDGLTLLRDLANRVRPRSSDVRTAIQAAGQRLEGASR